MPLSFKRPDGRDPRNVTRLMIALSIFCLLALAGGTLFWPMHWPAGDWRNGPLVEFWLPLLMGAWFAAFLAYGLIRLYRERHQKSN